MLFRKLQVAGLGHMFQVIFRFRFQVSDFEKSVQVQPSHRTCSFRLNVDILPAALCGALKSKKASAVALVDAYEAYLSQDVVQMYIGNAQIVDKAHDCAKRTAEQAASTSMVDLPITSRFGSLPKINNRALMTPLKGKHGKVKNPHLSSALGRPHRYLATSAGRGRYGILNECFEKYLI